MFVILVLLYSQARIHVLHLGMLAIWGFVNTNYFATFFFSILEIVSIDVSLFDPYSCYMGVSVF